MRYEPKMIEIRSAGDEVTIQWDDVTLVLDRGEAETISDMLTTAVENAEEGYAGLLAQIPEDDEE